MQSIGKSCGLMLMSFIVGPLTAGSEPGPVRAKPSVQDHVGWNVRYFRQIRGNSTNSSVSNSTLASRSRSNFVITFLCRGNTPETRGTAFVVYEDIFDAKNARDHLSGFNVCNRYLVVLYYQSTKAFKQLDVDKKQDELDQMKAKYNISTEELRK